MVHAGVRGRDPDGGQHGAEKHNYSRYLSHFYVSMFDWKN
jgi:hypothetical protein